MIATREEILKRGGNPAKPHLGYFVLRRPVRLLCRWDLGCPTVVRKGELVVATKIRADICATDIRLSGRPHLWEVGNFEFARRQRRKKLSYRQRFNREARGTCQIGSQSWRKMFQADIP
jgi:hypothetical protein